jgi:asparagine synthase (glutamine-hydrolysing)
VLTGIGGDEWFTGSRFHHADDLHAGRLDRVVRRAWADARHHSGVRRTLNAVTWHGVWPLVPSAGKAVARRLRGPRDLATSWLPSDFVRRTALADRVRAVASPPAFPTFAQRDMWRTAFSGWSIHGTEMEDRFAAELGIELRHPLSDVRIARFGLAIPEDQRWRRAERKRVLRAAAAGLVPEAVRCRRDKPDFSPLVVRALAAHGGEEVFRDLAIAEQGWIDPAPLAEMYRNMLADYSRANDRYMSAAWTLWMICGIERWFRAASRQAPPDAGIRDRVTMAAGLQIFLP